MSRWLAEFKSHPFQHVWGDLLQELSTLEVDDATIASSVEEIARLKKVTIYIDQVINALDPELTPKSVWSNFQPQAENCLNQVKTFSQDRDIGHIVKANDHADNLLSYVKPFLVAPIEAIEGLAVAARGYADQFGQYAEKFSQKTKTLVDQIQAKEEESKVFLENSEAASREIKEYFNKLFSGNDSIKEQIDLTQKNIKEKESEILSAYQQILIADKDGLSTKQKISNFESTIRKTNDEITLLLNEVKQGVLDLSNFYVKVYGEVDQNTGNRVGGLSLVIDQKIKSLEDLKTSQEEKYTALFEKIETLLPGATSAGLASAYKAQKEKFKTSISTFTYIFYGSLVTLVICGLIMVVQSVGFEPNFKINFLEVGDWDQILKALLYKAPFTAVVVWLALFASKRRSQYERLQQEYAHKEALASSYESYKKQVELLGDEDKNILQRHLIEKAIDAIAFNASSTLDGDHREKLPLEEMVSQVATKVAEKIAPNRP